MMIGITLKLFRVTMKICHVVCPESKAVDLVGDGSLGVVYHAVSLKKVKNKVPC